MPYKMRHTILPLIIEIPVTRFLHATSRLRRVVGSHWQGLILFLNIYFKVVCAQTFFPDTVLRLSHAAANGSNSL